MVKELDKVLLGENVVNAFLQKYEDEKFKSWLLNILPEVEDCKNLKQDNPWHIYNCLEHILHSVENMNKQSIDLDYSTRRLLSYTMFLHDIGKPECYIRRYSKLYKREVDSFFNHNIAGVKIADRVLNKFGFDKSEIEVIKMLVKDHDIFMFITLTNDGNSYHKVLTNDVVLEEIEKLNKVGNGFELMKYLIMVGRSDNLAQNPKMTANSLKLLDNMNNILISLK